MHKSVSYYIGVPGFVLLSLAAAGASAAEVGRVISSQPVVETTFVPRRVCSTEPMLLDVAPTGGGALAGAAVGGLAGIAIGSGGGRAIATMIGFIAGSIVGDQIEANRAPQLFDVEHCSVQNFTEQRSAGWDVEYEYAGKRYAARLADDPGATIPVDVAPAGAAPLATAPVLPVVTAPRLVYARPDGYQAYPASAYPGPPYPQPGYGTGYPSYPVYSPRPTYAGPPISIGLGFTYIGGRRH
ncbi:MAG: hypothetical protein ABI589_05845 [Burkholderiales bacterium]